MLSIFEDQRGHQTELFFNTRVVRIAEALLYCARLYSNLGVDRDKQVSMSIRHGGLAGRELTSSTLNRRISPGRVCAVDSSEVTHVFRLGQVDAELVELVKVYAEPLFELFDFFHLDDEVYATIVDKFVEGTVN